MSIEKDHLQLEEAKAGDDVCIEIKQSEDKQQYSYERHFTIEDKLYSKVKEEIDLIFILQIYCSSLLSLR